MSLDIIMVTVIFFTFVPRATSQWKTCNPYSENDMYYCREEAICCENGGCCRPESNSSYWFLILGLKLLLLFVYFCVKLCCKNEARNEHIQSQSSRRDRETPRNTSGNVRNSIILVPELIEASRQSVTPPPSYEVALSAPLLHPDEKIPSYEDAMAGKTT